MSNALFCADGETIIWPYSTGGMTTARSEVLLAYLNGACAADRALASAQLRPVQRLDLFDDPAAHERARRLGTIGRRITETGTYQYARTLGETRLKKVFTLKGFKQLTRDQLVARILSEL